MDVYSHSRLTTFEQCRLKFKYQYIDKIRKPDVQGVEAFVGSRVHDTFQKLYDDLLLERPNSLEELLAYFREEWQRHWTPKISIVREGMTGDNYREYGEKCIRNYYARYHPFDQDQTIKTEAHIVFPLDGDDGHKLQGYIDRLARRADGTWEIHDYKTSRSLPTQATVDADRQLALYQFGLPSQWKDAEKVELVWHYVALDTTLRSTRTAEQLESLRKATVALIDEIEGTTEFPPEKSNLCDWCEFKAECPLWKHEIEVAGLAVREFTEDDGVRLATGYAETRASIDALKKTLETLREQVVEYAIQKDVMVIRGAGVRVHVSIKLKTKLPGKNDPGRPELVRIVKEAGQWEEVADLDAPALVKIIDQRSWPQAVLNKLATFVSREDSVTVRVTKVRDGK